MMMTLRMLSDVRLEFLEEGFLWHRADETFNFFSVLKNNYGWNREHTILRRQVGVLIDIEFADLEFGLVDLLRELVDNWTGNAARRAPDSPEVDSNGRRGGKNFCLEIC